MGDKVRHTGMESSWKEQGLDKGYTLSGPQVLESAAGFYIGQLYLDDEIQAWMPWSRDSTYFPTRKEAQEYLNRHPEDFE